MERTGTGTPHTPIRLTRTGATALVGVSIFTLALAVGGVFPYDGWHRVAYVSAFVAMSLANLATASGTFLPRGRARRALLLAVTPLAVVMMIALGVTLAFQFGWVS
jgi:hypothetical membrane protein